MLARPSTELRSTSSEKTARWGGRSSSSSSSSAASLLSEKKDFCDVLEVLEAGRGGRAERVGSFEIEGAETVKTLCGFSAA